MRKRQRYLQLISFFVSCAYHLVLPALAQDDNSFKSQYFRELSLLEENIEDGYSVQDSMVKVKKDTVLTISIEDAFNMAMRNNESIQSAIGSYMNSLLNYQSTMFQFQFSAGSLTYNYAYEYNQDAPTLSIANSVSQTLPSGFQFNLSNTASNNAYSANKDLSTNSNLLVSQSIIGSTRASNQNTILSAQESLAQAKLNLRNTVTETLVNIANQFRTVVFSNQSIGNMLESQTNVRKNIEKSQTLFDMGMISRSDLENMQLQEINSRLSIEQAQFQLRQTTNLLKVNIGLSVDDAIQVIPDTKKTELSTKLLKRILSREPQHRSSFLRSALVNNATLINDRIQLRSLKRSLDINIKKKNVQVNATGSLSYSSGEQTGNSQAALTMQLPLDNRSTVNSIRSNQTSLISGQQRFMRDCIELIRQESDTFQNVLYFLDRTKLTAKQLNLSKDIDEASRIKFKYGSISATDVQQNHQDYLEAIERLRQAENTYSQSVDNYRKLIDSYLQHFPVELSADLNTIFQTVEIEPGLRSITTPSLRLNPQDFTPEKPYKMCMALMHADIENL